MSSPVEDLFEQDKALVGVLATGVLKKVLHILRQRVFISQDAMLCRDCPKVRRLYVEEQGAVACIE
jgi:hypothetical protein